MTKTARNAEELIAEFEYEIPSTVRGADDSDDRWSVKKFRANGQGEVTAVGCCRKDKLQRGQSYRLLGKWNLDDRFGKQFVFSSIAVTEPTSLDAIERYIQKAAGIGPKKAKQIVGEYGEQTLEKCREHPGEVAQQLGMSLSVCEDMAEFLQRNQRLEKLTIEVESLLAGRGFPRTLPQKCIERWGVEAVETIKENPYRLRDFQGVGFRLCDALYEHLGLPMGALIRQTHCVLYAIESDITGSTWIPRRQIEDELRKKIGGAEVRVEEAIKDAIENEMIRERQSVTSLPARSERFVKSDSAGCSAGEREKTGRQTAARELFYSVASLADAESSFVNDLCECVRERWRTW